MEPASAYGIIGKEFPRPCAGHPSYLTCCPRGVDASGLEKCARLCLELSHCDCVDAPGHWLTHTHTHTHISIRSPVRAVQCPDILGAQPNSQTSCVRPVQYPGIMGTCSPIPGQSGCACCAFRLGQAPQMHHSSSSFEARRRSQQQQQQQQGRQTAVASVQSSPAPPTEGLTAEHAPYVTGFNTTRRREMRSGRGSSDPGERTWSSTSEPSGPCAAQGARRARTRALCAHAVNPPRTPTQALGGSAAHGVKHARSHHHTRQPQHQASQPTRTACMPQPQL